jgi:hypothetical protein
MKKAIAKLMFLSALLLITSVAWMPAGAGVSSGMMAQLGLPGQPPPKPGPRPGPTAPDGGSIPPDCGPTTCTGRP